MTRASVCTFRAAELKGSWCVTRDGAFYGDYNTRDQAVAAAKLGALSVEARGGAACVLVGTGAGVTVQ